MNSEKIAAGMSTIPSWLNEQFFEEIFVEKLKLPPNQFKIKIKAIIPTGGAGENYTSTLYRAKVDAELNDGTSKSLSLLLKALISMPELKQFSIFTKEKLAYEELLPSMEQIWAKAGVTIAFGPRCWKTVEGDVDIIVLDDLCADGYSVANRQQGVDMAHVHVLLAKLAKFHAATATDYRKNGPINPLFDKGLVQEEGKAFFDQYAKLITPVFLESLNSMQDCLKYKNKLAKGMEEMFEKLYEATKKDDSRFVALCHGDVWTNNHMYSYHQSGEPNDVLLIDFQGPYYGSPVQDLLYYLISSTKLELKATQFDEMIQFYQENLADALRKLDYPGVIPNLRDVHMEILRRGYFAMQCLYGIMAIVLADKSENANFAGFVGEAEENKKFRHDVFNNPLFQKHLSSMLKLFDVRGLLDYD